MFGSKKSFFRLHGSGTVYFTNECDELIALTGEVIVGQDSKYQSAYVEVSTHTGVFLMPIKSVNSVKWDEKTKE